MNREIVIKKLALTAVKKLGEADVKKNTSYWPPYCMGILHQPKRPSVKNNNSDN